MFSGNTKRLENLELIGRDNHSYCLDVMINKTRGKDNTVKGSK